MTNDDLRDAVARARAMSDDPTVAEYVHKKPRILTGTHERMADAAIAAATPIIIAQERDTIDRLTAERDRLRDDFVDLVESVESALAYIDDQNGVWEKALDWQDDVVTPIDYLRIRLAVLDNEEGEVALTESERNTP